MELLGNSGGSWSVDCSPGDVIVWTCSGGIGGGGTINRSQSWAWSGSPTIQYTANTNGGTSGTVEAYTVSLTNNTGVTVDLTSSPWGNDSSFTNGEAKSDTRSSNSWSWSHRLTPVCLHLAQSTWTFSTHPASRQADHMPLTKLQFRPGVNQEVTSYSNEGGWRDCDKIRFRMGYPEKIGGWEKLSSSTYLGSARALHNWIALDGSNYLGVGTHLKYYIEEGASFNDITPIRSTTGAGDVTFSATDGSTTITVTDTGHGAVENDFVTFSGAASLGGNITATVLNIEYQVVSVINANSFTITASVAANSSDTGNGGSSTVGAYQINVGLDSTVGGTGWGAGLYGGVAAGALETTINEGGTFSDSDTTLTVTSGTGIAADDFILIDNEILKVTNVSTNDLTVTRQRTVLKMRVSLKLTALP